MKFTVIARAMTKPTKKEVNQLLNVLNNSLCDDQILRLMEHPKDTYRLIKYTNTTELENASLADVRQYLEDIIATAQPSHPD
jgi:hypothetical protein